MRRLLAFSALLLAAPLPALAQPGTVKVSGTAQALTGDPQLFGGQSRFEPDFGVSWHQPGLRFGTLQLELRGTRRDDRIHAGRMFVALQDVKFAGATWALEAGDTHYTPGVGEYRFSNLFTPPVTFAGAALSGRTSRSTINVVAGRATAWRNIFGGDPDTLGQTMLSARATHRATDRLDLHLRTSRIRTSDLDEFQFSIAASDQAGGGARFTLTPEVQIVGDASVVRYARTNSTARHLDGSGLIGLHWLHARGWVQVNASRFSPGEAPTLNSPLPDRSGLFTAGEYDVFSRFRIFAGWDTHRSNLDPAGAALVANAPPRTTGRRQFGGARMQLGSRSTLTMRVEGGDRISRPIRGGLDSESDTGSWTAEWQSAFSRLNAFARYGRRANVDRLRTAGSYTQHDASAQVFANVARIRGQIFGLLTVTRTEQAVGGSAFWQSGGGAQFQMHDRGLWMRLEATFSRNVDLLTELLAPRTSLNAGLNGQLTPDTSIGFNLYVDHAPPFSAPRRGWSTRSMVRITKTFRTRSALVVSSAGLPAATLERGAGSIRATVFADWNANGAQDAGEDPLEGIPMRGLGAPQGTTGREGEFAFLNVPAGVREIGVDVGALPVDYDPPVVPAAQVNVVRNGTSHLHFGLIPLGSVRGRVVRDENRNGKADENEPAVDGAVLVLDGGARSEQTRNGAFAFTAVRSGAHVVRLLLESLPTGAAIAGPVEQTVSLGRDSLHADVTFLVSMEQRPEIRRSFPGGSGGRKPPARDGRQGRLH